VTVFTGGVHRVRPQLREFVMTPEKQIGKIILAFVSVMVFGVAGLMIIEGWPLLDAVYMIVTTMSTVGYREVRPLSSAGMVFIIVFIVVGVGAFLYAITMIAEYVISGQLKGVLEKRRMKQQIAKLKQHYVVCGFGRVGQQVAAELRQDGMGVVVIDVDSSAISRCAQLGYLYLAGNASDDAVLKEAGIMEAAGLASAVDSDAENVYVTLSAKSLRRDLYVVARASSEEAEYKLLRAGADRVISPYTLGGKRLAGMLLRPSVVDFLELVTHRGDRDLFIEEIEVREGSPFEGITLGEVRQRHDIGANILAIKSKTDNRIVPNPESHVPIEKGDLLIILGTKDQLRDLDALM